MARNSGNVTKIKPSVPDPLRPLGEAGRATWERIWALKSTWISTTADIDHVQLLCETVDERALVRARVFADRTGDQWRLPVQLRNLDLQVASLLADLGLNPQDRKRLNAVSDEPLGKLAQMRAKRA